MMLVTLVGTIFPIISRGVSGHEVTVNQSFYNKVVGPMGMLLVALMAVGPMLVYGGDAAKRLVRGLIVPAILAVAIVAFAFVRGLHNGWALIATGIASLGVAAVLADFFAAIVHHVRNGEMPIAAIVRIIDGNHRRYGGQLAHLGMLMILVGIVGSSLFTQKENFELKENQTAQLGGFTLRFEKLEMVQQANFMGYEAVVHVTDRNGSVSTLRPQIRKYDKAEQNNSEVAIQSSWRGDLYLTLAGFENDIAGIQAIVNPLVGWIWIGGIVMAAGAVLCLLPRLIPIKLPQPVEAVAIPKMAKVNLKSA
jgi:cytochrome c-type biogenesis protein CcmF